MSSSVYAGGLASGFSVAQAKAEFAGGSAPTTNNLLGTWYLVGRASKYAGELIGYWPDGYVKYPDVAGSFHMTSAFDEIPNSIGNKILREKLLMFDADSGAIAGGVTVRGEIGKSGAKFIFEGSAINCSWTEECRIVAGQARLICAYTSTDSRGRLFKNRTLWI